MIEKVKIAVDAMGGEGSPKKIINGIELSLKKNKNNYFFLYGKKKEIENSIPKNSEVRNCCKIIDCDDFIEDNESPLTALKRGKNSSMWKAIESQKDKISDITLSAGNTGALLVMSRMILKTLDGIEKPALAGLWPNVKGMNIVLDLGANIECNEKNLVDFSKMGSALFKSLFQEDNPKIALLNIGLEEIKGNENLKKASILLKEIKNNDFNFIGYIEGNRIMSGDADVIVTDGFTGNVALKTAEGTANFITKRLKESLSKISILLSYKKLKIFKDKLDPRKYNGAIFLGLQGPVVKSHGSTDALGFAHSINMCNKIISGNLINKIKSNLNTID
jgi:phosphate acyltransferase